MTGLVQLHHTMEVSEEAVLFHSLVSENEPISPEEMCKLADGQLRELVFRIQPEMVLERTLYSWLNESWKTLGLQTSMLHDPDDGIPVLASA